MNEPIVIRVPAVPVAQPRPRAVLSHDRKSARIHELTSIKKADGTRKAHPIVAFKATTKLAAQQVYVGPPLDCALRCNLLFVMPRTKGQIWKKKPMPRLRHAKKPDCDNLAKSVWDALSGLIWVDDSQVCESRITKVIAAGSEQPHVLITITPFKESST